MCYAIPLALLLIIACAVLTVLRCIKGESPNADLIVTALCSLEDSPTDSVTNVVNTNFLSQSAEMI